MTGHLPISLNSVEKHVLTSQPTQMLRPGWILQQEKSKSQDAYFDIRIIHSNASCYVSKPLPALLRTHEQAKKKVYGQCIQDVEHGAFTPLVFSTFCTIGREATTFISKSTL